MGGQIDDQINGLATLAYQQYLTYRRIYVRLQVPYVKELLKKASVDDLKSIEGHVKGGDAISIEKIIKKYMTLQDMTHTQIKGLAKSKQLTNWSRRNKWDLIKELEQIEDEKKRNDSSNSSNGCRDVTGGKET